MEELGTTNMIKLNDIFDGEAAEFTPWLSANIGRLASELGFELEPEDTEVSVGSFRADIKAISTDGRSVVIENQFGITDHSHLGQLLTYSAGLSADIVIWVAERIRDEHRAAIDWLNSKAMDADFFAVEAKALQIDSSRPALLWDVVASPNSWTRGTKQTLMNRGFTELEKTRQEFWIALNERIEETGKQLTRHKPDRYSWKGSTIGKSNTGLNTIIAAKENQLTIEIFLGGDQADARYELLMSHRDQIETALGYALNWDQKEERKTRSISVSTDFDLRDKRNWPNTSDWIINKRLEFESVFKPLVLDLF